ncbi:hypothetical protein F2P81_020381 [Scophthalmus maximus]|uniref:Enolase 4 n=1 Tax=Scophthalmus maximus TaxID=52904 RepID=A0A6A4S7V2_SCOMX|nr:hypothetical protein F2P81_020381 [Scophthalmus maximus]
MSDPRLLLLLPCVRPSHHSRGVSRSSADQGLSKGVSPPIGKAPFRRNRLEYQERDTYETKVAAADFYRANRVPEEIERALNELFLRKPPDVHGFLADHFANLSAPPRIIRLNGRQVYDSRGQPSVEVDVFCIVRNKERVTSAGVSGLLGPEELADHVTTAVQWIDEPLNNMLQGQSPFDQSEVDRALSSFFRARSLEQDEIRNREKENLSPGASEVVPPPVTPAALHDSGAPAVSFEKPEQPLDLVGEACANLGLALGTDIHLAANCAARELMDYTKGKYEVTAGVFKSPDELMDVYKTLVGKYTAVVALIDPFRREDREQWEMLGNLIGGSCSLLSDVTQESRGPPLPGVRGHVLKHVHETTVSDLIRVASEHRGSVLMGTTYSEPCINDSLSDIVRISLIKEKNLLC